MIKDAKKLMRGELCRILVGYLNCRNLRSVTNKDQNGPNMPASHKPAKLMKQPSFVLRRSSLMMLMQLVTKYKDVVVPVTRESLLRM